MVGKDRRRKEKALSQAHLKIYQRQVSRKKDQLKSAIQYCKDNNCRGFKALKTGNFPLIKSPNTINNHLDAKVAHPDKSKDYCSILTSDEEEVLVKLMVSKNLAKQPFNRKDATKFIFTMLKLRQQINRNCNGGRKYKALSRPASKLLLRCNSKVMPKLRRFWERFDVRHSRRVRLKRRGSKSLKRAAACSEKAAKEHIGELAEELIARGIMEDAVKVESGVWTGRIDARRIMNNDETPQFIDYDVDGSANNLYYAGTGDECAAAISENRECVTIHPMINMEGDVMSCHVIFAAAGITSHMAPDEAVDKIENLLISTTEHGSQTDKGESLLKKSGDWECRFCTCNNFRSRDDCYRCKMSKNA